LSPIALNFRIYEKKYFILNANSVLLDSMPTGTGAKAKRSSFHLDTECASDESGRCSDVGVVHNRERNGGME
jgi:hypothetical protein